MDGYAPMIQQYESTLSSLSDPRLDQRFFSTAGDILLVGVLHDHPASIARVETVINAVEPETVALEVPPLALPYYSQCAGAGAIASGEMSAAIAAAPTATPVGIDLPSLSGLPELVRQLLDSTSLETAKRLVSRFTSVLVEIGRCRVAAIWGNLTAGDQPIEYDCEGPPRAQAEHELSSLRQSERVFAAMERSDTMSPSIRSGSDTRRNGSLHSNRSGVSSPSSATPTSTQLPSDSAKMPSSPPAGGVLKIMQNYTPIGPE